MNQPTPNDLIPIADAQELVGRSRTWIASRVTIYRVGRVDMVSKSAVLAAKVLYETPKPVNEN